MGDRFSALLVSLMALRLAPLDQNLFRPCLLQRLGTVNIPLAVPVCVYLGCVCVCVCV